MREHTPTIVSTTYGWTEAGQQWGYRGVCDCGWRGRKFPLSQQQLVEAQVADHLAYVRAAAGLTTTTTDGE